MTLIVLSGLPGVGKSTLAERLALRLGAIWLRIDTIEAGINASALAPENSADAGYRAAVGVAADNLALGHTVIADAVNGWPPAWGWWRLAAAQADTTVWPVEAHLDKVTHRARVEARHAGDPHTPDWAAVMARDYMPWPDALPLDMMGDPQAVLHRAIDVLVREGAIVSPQAVTPSS